MLAKHRMRGRSRRQQSQHDLNFKPYSYTLATRKSKLLPYSANKRLLSRLGGGARPAGAGLRSFGDLRLWGLARSCDDQYTAIMAKTTKMKTKGEAKAKTNNKQKKQMNDVMNHGDFGGGDAHDDEL